MIKIKDRILLGVVSGLIGSTPAKLINKIEHQKGLTVIRYNQIPMKLFTRQSTNTSRQGNTLAAIANGVNSGAIGVLMTYLFSATGRDHAVVKGMGLGAFAWVVLNGFIGSQMLKGKSKSPTPPILSFVDHIINGGTVGWLIAKLGDESLFPDTKALRRGEKLPTLAMNDEKKYASTR